LGRKKGSYKFEKRQKELKKQKKKREKLERRQNKGNGFDDEPQPSVEFGHLPGDPAEPDSETDSEN
jgi:hypothetical protein